ncbi:Pyridine nucleotide-disulfide oxidoreductase [Gracilaria domingensis]|nr:Pyridine nucleotide-disulfide oxidoreductase [Gracilaria domingensis]
MNSFRCVGFALTPKFGNIPHMAGFRLVKASRCTITRSNTTKAVLRPNIAIVGGGHAGISVALRLSTLPWTRLTKPKITVIDKSPRFCFLPMLYELALGQVEQWEIAPKFETLLQDTSIEFLQGEVEGLDLHNRTVEGFRRGKSNNSSFRVSFDRAVLSMGAEPVTLSSVPGADELAIPFYNLSHANRLKQKLKDVRKRKRSGDVTNVVIVGGGFSGVELASCMAEEMGSSGSVMIIEPSDHVLTKATPFNRKTSERALLSNGVVVEYRSRVTGITEKAVEIRKQEGAEYLNVEYPYDIVVWTAGSTPNIMQQTFGLPTDSIGRILTDRMLQVEGHTDCVYALGDGCSAPSENGYYGTAQVAVQQAEYAAWNVWASLTNNPKLRFSYTHLGEMMVLGSSNASVTTALGPELDGTVAWAARRLAYLLRMPTENHRRKVAASWAAHPLLSKMESLVRNPGVSSFGIHDTERTGTQEQRI